MKKMGYLISISMFVMNILQAQLPFTFKQVAHINNGGFATDIAIASDSLVFLANGEDGLRAYKYNGTVFINTAHIDDGGQATGVAIGPENVLFLANGDDGLRAYTYDGASFTNTAHIDEGGYALSADITTNGTVLLANGEYGLRAYAYDGNAFTNTAHVNNGGLASDVKFTPDGTLFLANGDDGLRAYTYDGNSFTNTAHVNDSSPFGGRAVTVSTDGTVMLANGDLGLWAYTLDGTSFTNAASMERIGFAADVTTMPDGTIFVAISQFIGGDINGILALDYDGSTFSKKAEIYFDDDTPRGIAVTSEGIVLLANGYDGLFAFSYSNASEDTEPLPYTFSQIHHFEESGHVAFDPDGTIFIVDNEAGLRAYNDGNFSTALAQIDVNGIPGDIDVGGDGTIFLTIYDDGLRAYEFDGASFVITAYIKEKNNSFRGLAAGPDSTVFTTHGFEGMQAYQYTGSSFLKTAYFQDPGFGLYDVTVDARGTIFTTHGSIILGDSNYDGLRAFRYTGDSLIVKAHVDNIDYTENWADGIEVSVSDDGMIYLANVPDAIRVFQYEESAFNNTAHIQSMGVTFGVAMAADETTFLANGPALG
ncbi:MAG: WD40 repeat domain-containing protein, partial [Calditrichaeota bacterium]